MPRLPVDPDWDRKRFRVFVLGAGFSCAANFPLANNLWREVKQRAERLEGRAAKFHQDVEEYIRFRRDCDGARIEPDNIPFEDFMEFLDLEHLLGMRGSDTWSADGNEGTVVTKFLIGQVLADAHDQLDRIPEVYLEFARRLQPNDIVITFNFDTLLELACDAVGTPYCLAQSRYREVHGDYAVVDNSIEDVSILKLHGSIDWFSRQRFDESAAFFRSQGLEPHYHPIFSNAETLGIEPVVSGPRPPGDPMLHYSRVRKFSDVYNLDNLFFATPAILSPSKSKYAYLPSHNEFLRGVRDLGSLNFGLSVVGFSLPQQDLYARQILWNIFDNYQRGRWRRRVFGKKKSKAVLVDYFRSEQERRAYRRRYRFVNWRRAKLLGSGFATETVDSIFAV